MSLKNLNVSLKLVLAFAVLIAVSVTSNIIVYTQLRTISGAAQAAVLSADQSALISDAYRGVIEHQNAVRGYGIDLRPEFLATATESEKKTLETIEQYIRDSDSPEQKARGEKLKAAYDRWRIHSVRKQLAAPGWSALAQVHRRDDQEDVDVYVNTDGDKILGLAVVASEPRSFTIVHIVGNIDIDKLAKIEGEFGIPRIGPDDAGQPE